MRLRGRVLKSVATAVSTALLTACAASQPADSVPARQDSVGRQFDLLVSRANGYHYPPFLREQSAGPEAQSHALRTLTDLGREPRTSVSVRRMAALRREALASSPLWGRDWLVPLRRAGAPGALGASDVRAVAKSRTKGGWYVDAVLGDDEDAARLGATWAALGVLGSLGRGAALSDGERSVTAAWLRSLAHGPRPLDQSAALASALRLLGRRVPAALTGIPAPRTDDWAGLTPDGRAKRLDDTYHYVLVKEAADERPDLDRAIWEAVLREGATSLPYEQVHHLVHILKAAGSSESVFVPVIRRLEGERLDDGTVRDPGAYLGNPDASLFVERLRALVGSSREDPRLRTALDREEKSGKASQEAAERLGRAALRTVATGRGGTSDTARRLCADPAVVPATVTDRNATLWQRTSLNCADAGAAIAIPEIAGWETDTPERVVAAATVTVGLADAGRRDAVPRWMTATAFRQGVLNPGRFGSVYEYVLVARAYTLLGGALDAPLRTALTRGVTRYKGCPQLPDLYRIGGGDDVCDLKTTWGVWALDRQLHGAMGWMPSRNHDTTEHRQ